MLRDWDKLQDLRRGGSEALNLPMPNSDITHAVVFRAADQPPQPKPDIAQAIEDAADRITAYRVVNQMARKDKMSLLGKLQHLTESAQDFHKETEQALDGIAAKIEAGKQKRDEATAKHHAYYDAIIGAVEESTQAIDRLSNGPLHGDGKV